MSSGYYGIFDDLSYAQVYLEKIVFTMFGLRLFLQTIECYGKMRLFRGGDFL